jgi:hypothetical protein
LAHTIQSPYHNKKQCSQITQSFRFTKQIGSSDNAFDLYLGYGKSKFQPHQLSWGFPQSLLANVGIVPHLAVAPSFHIRCSPTDLLINRKIQVLPDKNLIQEETCRWKRPKSVNISEFRNRHPYHVYIII